MNESKNWYASKTMWVAIATAILPAALALADMLPKMIDATYVGAASAVLGVIIGVLRVVTGAPIGKPKAPPASLLLPLVAVLAMSGCDFMRSVDWDKVIKMGGVLVDAAGKATPYTCAKLEELGAGPEHLARCYKADSAIKTKVGPTYGIGAGIVGTFATTAPVEVPGVGPVQVMAISPNAKPLDLVGVGKGCIGFKCPTTAGGGVEVVDKPPVQ